jgi:hypothetical protein
MNLLDFLDVLVRDKAATETCAFVGRDDDTLCRRDTDCRCASLVDGLLVTFAVRKRAQFWFVRIGVEPSRESLLVARKIGADSWVLHYLRLLGRHVIKYPFGENRPSYSVLFNLLASVVRISP